MIDEGAYSRNAPMLSAHASSGLSPSPGNSPCIVSDGASASHTTAVSDDIREARALLLWVTGKATKKEERYLFADRGKTERKNKLLAEG